MTHYYNTHTINEPTTQYFTNKSTRTHAPIQYVERIRPVRYDTLQYRPQLCTGEGSRNIRLRRAAAHAPDQPTPALACM